MNDLLKLLLLAFLTFPTLGEELYYVWELKEDSYVLLLFLDPSKCKELKKGTVFLFLTPKGRVFRKTLKWVPKNCKVYKRFKNQPEAVRVLHFEPSTLKVENWGVIKPY